MTRFVERIWDRITRRSYKGAHGVYPEDDTLISPDAQAVAEHLLSDRLVNHRASWWHQVRTSGSPLEPTLFRPEEDVRP